MAGFIESKLLKYQIFPTCEEDYKDIKYNENTHKYMYKIGKDYTTFVLLKLDNNCADFWSGYAKYQNKYTARLGVYIRKKNMYESISISDGLGSFISTLNMKKGNYDVWIAFVTRKTIKYVRDIEIKFESLMIDGVRIYYDDIEMATTVFMDKETPIVTHMGIFRNWKYLSNHFILHPSCYGDVESSIKQNIKDGVNKPHISLSIYLHSFIAKTVLNMCKNSNIIEKKYMLTNPAKSMQQIFIEYYKKLSYRGFWLEKFSEYSPPIVYSVKQSDKWIVENIEYNYPKWIVGNFKHCDVLCWCQTIILDYNILSKFFDDDV